MGQVILRRSGRILPRVVYRVIIALTNFRTEAGARQFRADLRRRGPDDFALETQSSVRDCFLLLSRISRRVAASLLLSLPRLPAICLALRDGSLHCAFAGAAPTFQRQLLSDPRVGPLSQQLVRRLLELVGNNFQRYVRSESLASFQR